MNYVAVNESVKTEFFHENDVALIVVSENNDDENIIKDICSNESEVHSDDIALITENYVEKERPEGIWYIDSAATRHMTHSKDILMDYENYPEEKRSKVFLGNDLVVKLSVKEK